MSFGNGGHGVLGKPIYDLIFGSHLPGRNEFPASGKHDYEKAFSHLGLLPWNSPDQRACFYTGEMGQRRKTNAGVFQLALEFTGNGLGVKRA